MVCSFSSETLLYTLAAVGLAVLVREAWLWLFRRPKGAPPVVLTVRAAPEDMGYILDACTEIRRYYFPGLTVRFGGEEGPHAKRIDQN